MEKSKEIIDVNEESISITKNSALSVNRLIDIDTPVGATVTRSALSQPHTTGKQTVAAATEALYPLEATKVTDSPNLPLSPHDTPIRRVGRPTKAEAIQRKHRSESAGNIKDLLKRKRNELEHDLMDKIMASSPFKKSVLTPRSPPKDIINTEQKIQTEPIDTVEITEQVSEILPTRVSIASQNVAVGQTVGQTDVSSLLNCMRSMMADMAEMKQDNKAHAAFVQRNLVDSKRENAIFLEQFKKEVRDDLEKNITQQTNSLREVEERVSRKLMELETKLVTSNPKGALEELNLRVRKLEEKTPSNSAPNDKLLSELTMLKKKTERQEKDLKRNNIVIKGLQLSGTPAHEDVEAFLHEEFGLVNGVADVRAVGGKEKILFVKLINGSVKEEIMKRKSKLGGRKIYIDHERTAEEMAIQNSIKAEARALKEEGKTVKIKYQKLIVDGEQFVWKHDKGQLEPSKQVTKEKTIIANQPPPIDSLPLDQNSVAGTSQSGSKN